MTANAQQALRRCIEMYSTTCRFVLCATSLSRLIEPLRSRTLLIRVPAPLPADVSRVLKTVCEKEGVGLPEDTCENIVAASGRNMRRALGAVQTMYTINRTSGSGSLPAGAQPEMYEYELAVQEIANMLLQQQTPQQLHSIRAMFYELLSKRIEGDDIIRMLAASLMTQLDSSLKLKVAHWAAYYEHRMKLGQKPVFHLEAFAAKFMCIYKNYMYQTLMCMD